MVKNKSLGSLLSHKYRNLVKVSVSVLQLFEIILNSHPEGNVKMDN